MKKYFSKTQDFICRAQEVHGNRFDYSKVKYKSSTEKVIIICPRHGEFKQEPSAHLRGYGCPYCSYNRPTKEEFITLLAKLYGDNIDFSKCTYTHKIPLTRKITMTCKIHGDFTKSAIDLLKGKGCDRCTREAKRKAKLIRKTQPVSESAQKSEGESSKITYPVVIRFNTNKSKINGYLWTEPFESKSEAEQFAEDLKLCLDMIDSVVTEATIIEKNNKYLDADNAKKLIRWLNFESYDAFVRWWDEYRPSFIPRNLVEYYPNIDEMFGNDEIGIIISFLNRIRLSDNDERQRA
jgi:hypothetical protein